jgi:phenylalanyl-tRNA synthetase beta chain
MLVSFDWLKDFVDITAGPEEVADMLTLIGLEVEGIEQVEGDVVFDVNVTPNRPDCLSILGVAREVAAAFRLPLTVPETDVNSTLPASDIRIEILDSDLCNRYTGRSITDVTVGETPEWIRKRLEKCGIRALNNNIVDITNYVLLELGHPLHAFDADKLQGSIIKVAKAGGSRSIVTLDEIERNLTNATLLIWDAKNPVAIAGIMGGAESGVTSGTRNIFLESAHFEPVSVRKSSKALSLKTDSSFRFERGTDIIFLENALNRAAMLIQQVAGGVIHEMVDSYPVQPEYPKIDVSVRRVNEYLGTDIEKKEMIDILERLGITAADKGDVLDVNPPAFRKDIMIFVDVVEEIARCYHYTNIPVTIPKTTLSEGVISIREARIRKLKQAIRTTGFTEVINYSFMSPSDLDLLGLPEQDVRRHYVTLKNPLRQEESLLRSSLIPSLMQNVIYNLSRGSNHIGLFELSRIFEHGGEHLPREVLTLGGIYLEGRSSFLWKDTVPPFFVVKGALETLFEEIKCRMYELTPSTEVFLHSGKAADIYLGKERAGFIGELSPHIIEKMNIKIQKPEIIVFELNIDLLLNVIPETIAYKPIPKYPSIERDIALVLNDNLNAVEILRHLEGFHPDVIERVELFDVYRGKNLPENKKSLAFRIVYRAPDRTLTESEIEPLHTELVTFITGKTGGVLRGH